METVSRKIDWLSIDLITQQARSAQAARALTIEERTKRALAKGDALLAQARLARKLADVRAS